MISILWLVEVVALAALAGGVGTVVAWRGRIWLRHGSAAAFWSSPFCRSQSVWNQIEAQDDRVITRLFLTLALPPTCGLVPLIAPWSGYSDHTAVTVALLIFGFCVARLLWAFHRRSRYLLNLQKKPAPRTELVLPPARKGFTEAEFELLKPRNTLEAGSPLWPGIPKPTFFPPFGRSGPRH